jgi:hypothetical protein
MSNESKTFIHKDNWLYGPCDTPMPSDNWRSEESETLKLMKPTRRDWQRDVLLLPKVRWVGPVLPDWEEMTEGLDFELSTYRFASEEEYNEAKAESQRELVESRPVQLFAYPIPVQSSTGEKDSDNENLYKEARKIVAARIKKQGNPDGLNQLLTGIGFDMFLAGYHHAAQSPSTSGEKLYMWVNAGVRKPDSWDNISLRHAHNGNAPICNDQIWEFRDGYIEMNHDYGGGEILYKNLEWLEEYTPVPDGRREAIAAMEWIREKRGNGIGWDGPDPSKDWTVAGDSKRYTTAELYALFTGRPVQVSEEQELWREIYDWVSWQLDNIAGRSIIEYMKQHYTITPKQ